MQRGQHCSAARGSGRAPLSVGKDKQAEAIPPVMPFAGTDSVHIKTANLLVYCLVQGCLHAC